jgi:hypothetical protein
VDGWAGEKKAEWVMWWKENAMLGGWWWKKGGILTLNFNSSPSKQSNGRGRRWKAFKAIGGVLYDLNFLRCFWAESKQETQQTQPCIQAIIFVLCYLLYVTLHSMNCMDKARKSFD